MGYVGELRWRVVAEGKSEEAGNLKGAIDLVFAAVFQGTDEGNEVESRAPVHVKAAGSTLKLVRDERYINGWHFILGDVEGTVGKHEVLAGFVADHVGRLAHKAWARGVKPRTPAPLGKQFSFKAFASADEPAALCQELAAVLTARIQAHPSPAEAFESAMQELKALGHDLWSYTLEEVWGCDYMTRRKGAGLLIQRYTADDAEDDEVVEPETVSVEFKPPEDQ